MKASLDQLRALLAKTTDLNQIIALETEIARRQADLDSLQAQLNALDKKVAMSTVSVTLVTAANVVVPEEDSSGFLGGLRSGWKAFLGASSGALMVLGAVLPFVVLLAIVAVPLLWWRRRRSEQQRATPAYASWGPPAAGSSDGGGSAGPNGGSGGSGGPDGPDGGSGGHGGGNGGAAAPAQGSGTSGQSGSAEGSEGLVGGSGTGAVDNGGAEQREPEPAGAGTR